MMSKNAEDSSTSYYPEEQLDHHSTEQELRESLARSLGITQIIHKELSHAIVGAAIEVHRRIGPGMLERAYQRALECELRFRGILFVAQAPITLSYRDCQIEAFFADFIVDEKIILEIKSVERYTPLHRAQVYSYLGASNLHLGMLINFNVPVLYRSICRVVR
jgi:GxxExxY protein